MNPIKSVTIGLGLLLVAIAFKFVGLRLTNDPSLDGESVPLALFAIHIDLLVIAMSTIVSAALALPGDKKGRLIGPAIGWGISIVIILAILGFQGFAWALWAENDWFKYYIPDIMALSVLVWSVAAAGDQ